MKRNPAPRLIHLSLLIAVLFSVNCGGGGPKNLLPTPTPQPSTPPSITTTSLPNGVATKTYTFTLEANGGSGTKTWSIASGALPGGLNLDAASGTISGTPSAPGQSTVSFKVQDSGGSATTPSLNLFIDPVLQITTDAQLPNATRGVLYKAPVMMTNTANGAIRWTILSLTLPQGLGLLTDPQNRNQLNFSGIPIQLATNFSFTLQAQDSDVPPQTVTKTFTISVTPGLPVAHVPAMVPNAIMNTAYSYQFVAVGGTPPYHWTSSAALPPGLTVSADGVLSGTPTNASTRFSFSVNVTDSSSAGGPAVPSSITVSPAALSRNDRIDTATTITVNGSYQASISPFSDPSSLGPDSDYFKLIATPGTTVTITAGNGRQRVNVTVDPVIEILKADGSRFSTCQNPEDDNPTGKIQPDPTPSAFDDDCLNDDSSPDTVDSKLIFQVPNVGTPTTTFYLHVFDWRGDARPDMTYTLTISGLQ